MSNIHDTIGKLSNLQPPCPDETIARLASLASILRESEQVCSVLGVAEVWFTRLPNSMMVNIFWNDSDEENKEVFLASIASVKVIQNQVTAVLNKYLKPVLTEDFEWLKN